LDRFLKELGPELAFTRPAVPEEDTQKKHDQSGQQDDFDEFPLGLCHLLRCRHEAILPEFGPT
jgi:hypothetical protein